MERWACQENENVVRAWSRHRGATMSKTSGAGLLTLDFSISISISLSATVYNTLLRILDGLMSI